MIDFTVSQLVMRGCAVLFASTVHGLALAAAACALGDKTPRHDGRLTIDPLLHVDAIGGLVALAFLIGWPKWIDIDPRALRHGRAGVVVVIAAGVAALVIAALVLRLIRPLLLPLLPDTAASAAFVLIETAMDTTLLFALVSLVPVPPLAAGHIWFALVPAWRERDWRIDFYLDVMLAVLVITGWPTRVLAPVFYVLAAPLLGM